MKKEFTMMLVGALLCGASGASAQEAGQVSATDLPKLTVTDTEASDYAASVSSTGTKTDTPLLETPLSIQVIPQQVLQDQNATSLDQVLRNVSGVKSDKFASQEVITLRGFTTSAVFRNGFRIDDTLGAAVTNLSNVDSVEVLKGPAAILYGRVEPGGVVNVVTKQPLATAAYSIDQSMGSYDHYVTDLDATGPLNEGKSVRYRVVATYDTAGSWRYGPARNDELYTKKAFIAPTLQWLVSDRTQVTLEGEYNHYSVPYDIGQLNPLDTSTNRYVQLPRDVALLTAPTDIDTRYLGVNWSHQFNDQWSVRQQFAHDYNRYGLPQWLGLDYANFPDVFAQSGTTWTVAGGLYPLAAEQTVDASILDLTGHFETAGVQHTLLVGADYYRVRSDGRSGASNTFVTTDALNPTPVTGLTLDPTLSSDSRQKWQNYGVYAQDQLKLPGRVEVLAGLRYQKVTEASRFQAGEGNPFVVGDPQDDHAVTPRLGVLWLARDDLSFYGNYAENFGANTGRSVGGAPLDPETAKQYEVGMKSQLMGGTLTSTLALFNLTKQNVATADPANPGFNLAIGEVRSRGVEFDIQGEVARGWNMIATYAYTDIVITRSNNGDQGLRMMNVPRNMASLSTTYKLQQPMMRRWKIGGGVYWRDATPDATNTLMTPARAVINAMAAYAFEAGRHKATFQLNVDNLFDKRYIIDAQQFGNAELYTNGSPRTVTAVVRLEL